MRVLVAQDGDEIVGIAPLMLSKYAFMGIGQIRKLEFVAGPDSDYNNFILLRKGEECMKLFLTHLREQRDWDFLQLTDLREGTESCRLLSEVGVARRLGLEYRLRTLCPYVELPDSVGLLIRALHTGMCKYLHRKMRGLGDKYSVGTKTHADFRSIDEAMDVLFDLHERRWRAKGETESFANKTARDFNKAVARLFAEKGMAFSMFPNRRWPPGGI